MQKHARVSNNQITSREAAPSTAMSCGLLKTLALVSPECLGIMLAKQSVIADNSKCSPLRDSGGDSRVVLVGGCWGCLGFGGELAA